MDLKRCLGLSLAVFLGGTVAAPAQSPSAVTSAKPSTPMVVPQTKWANLPGGGMVPAGSVLPMQYQPPAPETPAAPAPAPEGSAPSEAAPEEPKWGPTLPEDVKALMGTGVGDFLQERGLRVYGWLDAGYTYASVGPGLLSVEPRENRFGDEFLLNQLAIVLERPLKADELSFGFNVTYYGGADAALLQPKGGIDDPPGNPRFSHDFRQLYASAHLPILSEGGVDVRVGRMGTIIGYESALAPYRPFYSNDYQWFYSQDGAWTGFLTNWHVNKQLDFLNGMTLGANTFFTKRSEDSFCYIGQINYWLQEEKKTLLSTSLHIGRDAIFSTPGALDTVVEFRVQHEWSKYLTQIVQSDDGWSTGVPFGASRGQWYSLYTILICHLNKCWDFNTRLEWFDDVRGTVTGIATAYDEVTLALDYHPSKCIQIRPEVRGDFADERAFGRGGIPRDHNQLTAAVDLLLKY